MGPREAAAATEMGGADVTATAEVTDAAMKRSCKRGGRAHQQCGGDSDHL